LFIVLNKNQANTS